MSFGFFIIHPWITEMTIRINHASGTLTLWICIVACQVLITQTNGNAVYSVTFEACKRSTDTSISGTDSVIRLRMYNKDGSSTHVARKFEGQGEGINSETKHVVDLSNAEYIDLGPVCVIGLRTTRKDVWRIKSVTVHHLASQMEGIFMVNNCDDNNRRSTTGQTWSNYTSEAQWQPWGECDCATRLRYRIRNTPNCGEFNSTKTENQSCQPLIWNCYDMTYFIIAGAVMAGLYIIFLFIIMVMCCKLRRRQSEVAKGTYDFNNSYTDDSPDAVFIGLHNQNRDLNASFTTM